MVSKHLKGMERMESEESARPAFYMNVFVAMVQIDAATLNLLNL